MRGPDSLGRGWWRRNVWGLIALLPALALMLAAAGYSDLEFWQRGRPAAVLPATDGVADFAGVRVRVAELAPATDLKRSGGRPLALPENVTAWRVVLDVEGPADPEQVPYCEISVEDTAGNLYGDQPLELSLVSAPLGNCKPDNSPVPAASGRHQTVALFVTPRGVDIAAVRVSFGTVDQTRYVRFDRS
ncbi:hypothetical protein Cme02nite_42240 [Catellatospora methionotrophica]|uniref:Uncharacterized protein n=1 Tax=Catellatospora methionotrophica TaxID=121620 RepID=A0A8J3LB97_9ACTN|nr:hypothetical protein [Catellatospora methionotrophica]GIG15892.1 hypothetical protein Cme02nite_42240 [Catellatospora methionotrophica]